jgi:hypothetical protein
MFPLRLALQKFTALKLRTFPTVARNSHFPDMAYELAPGFTVAPFVLSCRKYLLEDCA